MYKEQVSQHKTDNTSQKILKLGYGQNIRFGTLNCKGLKPHGEDIKQQLLVRIMQNHNIDVLFLQETHVNTNCSETLKGHTFIYSSSITDDQRKQAEAARMEARNRAKGQGKRQRNAIPPQPASDREYHGVAAVLSPNAKLLVSDYEQISSRLMRISFYSAGPPIHVFNAYAPQSGADSHSKEAFYDQMESSYNSFPLAHPKFIFGDFNARIHAKCYHEPMLGPHIFGRGHAYLQMMSEDSLENRRLFLNLCAACDLAVMNTWFQKSCQHQFTFREPASKHEPPWGPDRFAQLDFVLAPGRWKNSVTDVSARTAVFTDSDHYIVTADCRIRLQARIPSTPSPKFRPPTPQQKSFFNAELRRTLRATNCRDISTFVRAVQDAESSCFTVISPKQRQPHISARTWNKILCRNAAHERNDWETVSRLSAEIKRDSRKDKREALLRTLEQCNDAKEKWEGPKILKSKKIIKFTKLKDRHGNRVGFSERAEKIADYLHHVQWSPAPIPPAKQRPKILDIDLGLNTDSLSVEEVADAIRKMKAGKAPGHDNLSIDTLKTLDIDNMNLLTQALNQWWLSEQIPQEHLKAMVVTLYKKGNTQDIANYRPISLLTCMYKIFTSILQTRIAAVLDPHLSDTQYGFRRARSTQQPLFIARRIQDAAEQSGNPLLMVFLDWEKAFDKLNHDRMFEALERMNIPPKMMRVIKGAYAKPFQVQHDDFHSSEYPQRCGIRQGCPLSPYLFIIVMSVLFADIRREHRRSISHGKLDHISFMELLYADDTLLITKNTRAMNILLHAVETESEYYGLKLNQTKCAAITTNRRHGIKFIDGSPVPHEEQVTYLGGIINRQVNRRAEVESRISSSMITWKRMHVFFKNARCPTRWKLIVYNSIIRSKLLYGLETLELTKPLMSKLEAFQLRGLRKILNMATTYIDRRNTNAEVYRRAQDAAGNSPGNTNRLTWNIQQCIDEKRIKLTGHLLRADNSDPMRQVSFQRNSALPYCPLFRRQGRPRKNWMVSSLELCWNKLHNSIFTNSAEQQAQLLTEARQRAF